MKINFLLKESEEDIIKLPQSAQEAKALIPDWIPFNKKEVTDKYLYNLWRKYEIRLKDQRDLSSIFTKDDKTWRIVYDTKDNDIANVIVPYESERLLFSISNTGKIFSCTLIDQFGYFKKQFGAPFQISYYMSGEKFHELSSRGFQEKDTIYDKDGTVLNSNVY